MPKRRAARPSMWPALQGIVIQSYREAAEELRDGVVSVSATEVRGTGRKSGLRNQPIGGLLRQDKSNNLSSDGQDERAEDSCDSSLGSLLTRFSPPHRRYSLDDPTRPEILDSPFIEGDDLKDTLRVTVPAGSTGSNPDWECDCVLTHADHLSKHHTAEQLLAGDHLVKDVLAGMSPTRNPHLPKYFGVGKHSKVPAKTLSHYLPQRLDNDLFPCAKAEPKAQQTPVINSNDLRDNTATIDTYVIPPNTRYMLDSRFGFGQSTKLARSDQPKYALQLSSRIPVNTLQGPIKQPVDNHSEFLNSHNLPSNAYYDAYPMNRITQTKQAQQLRALIEEGANSALWLASSKVQKRRSKAFKIVNPRTNERIA